MVDATESIKDVWKHKTPYTIASDTQEIIERYKKTMSSHDYIQLSSANQVQFEANERAVSAYKMVSGLIFAQSIEEMYLILCYRLKGCEQQIEHLRQTPTGTRYTRSTARTAIAFIASDMGIDVETFDDLGTHVGRGFNESLLVEEFLRMHANTTRDMLSRLTSRAGEIRNQLIDLEQRMQCKP
tara:strand:- start:509 stop:1060 length:552 start_codon:yes stop_codon:yes gene_type:complete